MSRTFKTNEDFAGGQEIEIQFLFRELIDYSGTYTHQRKLKPYGVKILRIQSIHMMHEQRMHL